MSLHDFIEHNYVAACQLQRNIELDEVMKQMISKREIDTSVLIRWMTSYNLFQGIKKQDRMKVANVYKNLALQTPFSIQDPNEDEIVERLETLMVKSFDEVPRKWLSAASKLLWCLYPDKVVIYDSFVERALIVLQPITDYLAKLPRIGSIGSVKTYDDIELAADFYRNYQCMVNAIFENHRDQLSSLRIKHGERYQHDIRIIDKLLWMIGRPQQSFQLEEIKCEP